MTQTQQARVVAGAVATPSYLPWVRALARSFAQHNPGGRLVVLLTDPPPEGSQRNDDQFEIVIADEVGIPQRELAWRRTIYDNTELCCSLKPWILRYLLRDADAALYLDSDICVYDSLAELVDLARQSGVAFTPHNLHPWVEDGYSPREENYIRDGQFNAGCVAVGRDGAAFLDWWDAKLARHCQGRTPDNPDHWFDQHWLDFAIGYFPVSISRDVGCNVAFWNLGSRKLEVGEHGVTVNGEPLRFMHYSAFNPANPAEFTKLVDGNGRPELYAPATQQLARDYAALLLDCGWEPRVSSPSSPLLSVRGPILHALRRAEKLGVARQIDPNDHAQLLSWLRSPYVGRISWFMWGFCESIPALKQRFPLISHVGINADHDAFVAWITEQARTLQVLPEGLGGLAHPLPAATADRAEGLRILVIEHDLPRVDLNSASLRLSRILKLMVEAGHQVTVIGRDPFSTVSGQRADTALLNLGVHRVLPHEPSYTASGYRSETPAGVYPPDGFRGFLRQERFDVAWLSYHWVAAYYLPQIRQVSPATRIVVDSVDVHWVRERRGAELTRDASGLARADLTRKLEQAVYSAADANVAVSAVDAGHTRELAPNVPVHVISNVHPIPAEPTSPDGRSGVLFVGSFHHRPNVDAMRWFTAECWPLIRAQIPDAQLTIAGTCPPDVMQELQALPGDGIHLTGWVPSIEPYHAAARVSIAPLRFGGGVKGKIGDAIAAGVPVVTTSIGAEGMGLEHGRDVLVADDAESFAAAVVRLSRDDALWTSLSSAARELLAQTLGDGPARAALKQMLGSVAPARWQAPADVPWLGELLSAYADSFPTGTGATLVLTVATDDHAALDAAASRVLEAATSRGIDLDEIADIEISQFRAELPVPARTLLWQPERALQRSPALEQVP